MTKMKSIVLIIAFLVSSMGIMAQKSWNPELKLKKGEVYKYQTTYVGTIVQSMGGMDMTMEMEGNSDMEITVASKEKDLYGISMKITLLNMSMKMPPMMDTTMMITDMPISTFTTDKYGNASKLVVQGEEKQNDFGMNMGSIGGNKTFQELPQNAIKTGDKWTSSHIDTTDFMGGSLVNISNIEYVCGEESKINDYKCLSINYISNIENAGSTQMQGMDFYIEGTGVQKGIVYIDIKTGLVIKEEITTENAMIMALSGQQNMTIPITQKFTVNRNLTK